VLLALGGHMHAESREGKRTIAAQAFFTGPLQTALTSTELLTEVRLPVAPPLSGAAFVEVNRRHGDFALVGAAAQVSLHENGTIAAAHLALLGVGDTPVHAVAAEAILSGQRPDEALFTKAAELASTELDPAADLHASAEYRREVAGVLISRALHIAARRASEVLL
jgi:carbon-monoxide dehydrogenase medium subunit